MTIFELIDAQNVRARAIANAVDSKEIAVAIQLSETEAPLKVINELLSVSNIPIRIDVQQDERIVATKLGGEPYSVAELSDGERNALLIAGDVFTAKVGSLLIIDEPERHLHRSIISPLLSLLFDRRSDCAFIVSTHDLDLPLDYPQSRVLMVRSCVYQGSTPVHWDCDLAMSGLDVDEELKKDIFGSRRKLLFVEGQATSLDRPLYSIIFPQVSVNSRGSCKEVENAVRGVAGAQELTWIHAVGLVDNDGYD